MFASLELNKKKIPMSVHLPHNNIFYFPVFQDHGIIFVQLLSVLFRKFSSISNSQRSIYRISPSYSLSTLTMELFTFLHNTRLHSLCIFFYLFLWLFVALVIEPYYWNVCAIFRNQLARKKNEIYWKGMLKRSWRRIITGSISIELSIMSKFFFLLSLSWEKPNDLVWLNDLSSQRSK